jgi:hypothetical protein
MGEAVKQKDARRERPNWGLALLMRPAKAAPGVPFVNSPLCQRPLPIVAAFLTRWCHTNLRVY